MLVTHRGEGGGHPQSWRTRACGGPHVVHALLLCPYLHPHAHPYRHGTRGNTMDKRDLLTRVFPAQRHTMIRPGQPTGGLITRRSQVQILPPLP